MARVEEGQVKRRAVLADQRSFTWRLNLLIQNYRAIVMGPGRAVERCRTAEDNSCST